MSRRIATLLVACTAVTVCCAQVPTPDDPFSLPPGTKVTLEFIDSIINGMKSTIWSVRGAAGHSPPDHRGRTIEQDVDQYLQTDAYLADLAKVREALPAAIPQGSIEVPAPAAEPILRMLLSEGCRIMTTTNYWGMRNIGEYHAALIQPLLEDLPTTEQPAARIRMDSLQTRLNRFGDRLPGEIAGCAQPVARNEDLENALYDDYNSLRSELANRLYELEINLPDPDEWVERSDPCPPPATTTTGQARVKVAERGEALQHYDEESRQYQVTGRVQIRLEVSPTGCVTRASVTRTSGAPLLDQAALATGFGYRFIPGVKDGKPVGQALLLPVSFSLIPEP